ncbi:putative F-box protein At1g49610 isoform X5 [Camellia sinensis]|uniref:putative F-box protein At1g49610 isoform X5 n=1 Tax=Camellia sinensis TaxID=4442 RepID=UPI0010368155|nr:putative F-box protein At1g49610 isoform X5 [Camellia sinensis]
MECGWTSICLKDLISYLPDGILVSILSRLEIEQAARTSALARRWRYLWTFTSSLIFKFCDWRIVDHEDKLFGLKCRQFVDWVNHILKFHRVSGPSLKLKYLEIEGCFSLKSVDIYDANLVSFKYSGLKAYIAFKNTPHLVKASFDGPYARYIVKNFIQVSSYLLQLETLELNLSWGLKKLRYFPRFPKLRNLRQLELMLNPGVSMLLCAYLLRASPLLRMLKIEFWDFKDSTKETKIRRPKHLHKSLKVLELNGFIGCKADLQIASYILGSTVSLQEIIIDPSHPNKWAPEDPDTQQLARMRARQHLETRLPFGTQLVLR